MFASVSGFDVCVCFGLTSTIYRRSNLELKVQGKAKQNQLHFSWCMSAFPCTNVILPLFNPLSPNSDQQQFSPNNIHTLSRDKVMRINKIIIIEKIP